MIAGRVAVWLLACVFAIVCLSIGVGSASAGVITATQISSSDEHACVVDSGHDVSCWGEDNQEQLGDHQTAARFSPVPADSAADPATGVAVGHDFSCALETGGTVKCWGLGDGGRLGDSNEFTQPTPTAVTSLTDATAITAGSTFACALLAGGEVWCWGNGAVTPAAVGGLSDVIAISAGDDHTCALIAGGTVKCWGDNADGELGDGQTGGSSAVPVSVLNLSNATGVAAGMDQSCATTPTGVECWGADDHGQLGDGLTQASDVPVTVAKLSGRPTSIAARATTTCAAVAGAAWCWGEDVDGSLGNGQAGVDSTTPTAVVGLGSGVSSTSGSCAITIDGAALCWGENNEGQLGNGSFEPFSATPVPVSGLGGGHGLTVDLPGDGGGTVSSSPSGIDCGDAGSACSTPFAAGETVTLTAVPDSFSHFTGFGGAGCSGAATTCTVMLDSDTAVTATFVANPHLVVDLAGAGSGVVTSDPAGIDCSVNGGAGCSAQFPPGTVVTLTASVGSGSYFAGISGDGCGGTATTCTVEVGGGGSTVSAHFDATPTVSIDSPSDGTVFAPGSVPAAQFSCRPGTGQTLAGCTATVDATAVANGGGLPAAPGSHTVVVRALDNDGATTVETVSYTVGTTGPACDTSKPYQFGIISAIGCQKPVTTIDQIPNQDLKELCDRMALSLSKCAAKLQPELASSSTAPEVTDQPVRINGLDLFPRNGSDIVFDPVDQLVASADVSIEIMNDRVSLYTGEIQVDASKPADLTQADDNLAVIESRSKAASAALDLGGWMLDGTLTVTLNKNTSTLSAEVVLPYEFKSDLGQALTLTASTFADDSHQPFQDFMVAGPLLDFGAFKLSNTEFCYQARIADGFCQQQTKVNFGSEPTTAPSWNVTGKISIGVGASKTFTLDAAPPPPTYGIGFVGGKFAFAGAQAQFNPGIPIGTGVTLTQIGGSVGLDPTRVYGTVGLGVGAIAEIDGGLFLVLPEHGQKYTFTGSEAGVTASTLSIPKITVNEFAMAVGGSLSLKIPVFGKTNLASGYVMYAYPSFVSFGGQVGISLLGGDLAVSGTTVGTANFAANQYELDGDLQAMIKFGGFINIGLEASGTISSVGIAACGQISWFGQTIAGGAGLKWGGPLQTMLGTCSLSKYQVMSWKTSGSAAVASDIAATAHGTFDVPSGAPAEVVQVYGKDGAPDITITGPSGTVDTAARQVVKTRTYAITRTGDKTWVSIIDPRPGIYRVRPDTDSVPLTKIASAHGLTPRIHAKVLGSGSLRRLTFTQNLGAGAKVSFIERGQGIDRLIASTDKRGGRIKFRPAAGPGGIRDVVAIATIDGIPQVLRRHSKAGGQLIVGRFRAPGPRKLKRVTDLRATEKSDRLTVTFKPQNGADKYAVIASLKNGIKTQYETKRTQLALRIKSAGPAGGTIAVMALGDQLHTVDGPVAHATVRVQQPKRKTGGPKRKPKRHKGSG